MHALLGLSASHLSWLTSSSATVQLAYQHRGLALQGLQQAIGNFSRHNADAVLAASILLSWQVTDWYVTTHWDGLDRGRAFKYVTDRVSSFQAELGELAARYSYCYRCYAGLATSKRIRGPYGRERVLQQWP